MPTTSRITLIMPQMRPALVNPMPLGSILPSRISRMSVFPITHAMIPQTGVCT
jgi:hypothetical protein